VSTEHSRLFSATSSATSDDDGPERMQASDELGRSFKALLAAVRRLRGRETRQHGGLSAADLAPATATEMLEGLAAAGLVTRERSERDRRVVLISLTARGRTLVEERREHLQPRWRAALAEFSDDELRCAARVLDRLQDMFDELPEEV